MKRSHTSLQLLIALATFTLCAFTASAQEASMAKANAADEAALRENVRQMEEGWNTKSGSLFAQPFATDADYVVINGMFIQGRDAIAKGHQGIFDTIYKDSTLKLSVKQLRFLRPDVAVVHVTGHNKFRRGEETRETDAIITMTMTKDKGEWKIAAFQNTQVIANPQR